MNSLSSKEEISSENCQKILSNSSIINDLIIKGNNKKEKEKIKEKEKDNDKENIDFKINKKEFKENKELKVLKHIRRNNINLEPKAKNLINGVTPIGEVKININQMNEKNKVNEIKNIPYNEDMKEDNYSLFNINDKNPILEKIEEIKRKHKNNKFQRYLLIKIPKSKKKKMIIYSQCMEEKVSQL